MYAQSSPVVAKDGGCFLIARASRLEGRGGGRTAAAALLSWAPSVSLAPVGLARRATRRRAKRREITATRGRYVRDVTATAVSAPTSCPRCPRDTGRRRRPGGESRARRRRWRRYGRAHGKMAGNLNETLAIGPTVLNNLIAPRVAIIVPRRVVPCARRPFHPRGSQLSNNLETSTSTRPHVRRTFLAENMDTCVHTRARANAARGRVSVRVRCKCVSCLCARASK